MLSMRQHGRPLLLLLLVVFVYGNSLNGSFQYDDEHSIVRNPSIQQLSSVPSFFIDTSAFSGDEGKRMYRPLLLTTYAFNVALHGLTVGGFHVVNILLHAICTILVWRLALKLSPRRADAAWIVAAVFAVHPVTSEPANYISSRSETLMAMFFLLTLLLHSRQRVGEAIPLMARVSMLLAMLSKETAIVLVAVLPLLDLWRSATRVTLRQMASRHVPYGLLAAAYTGILFWTGFLGGEGGAEPVRDSLSQFFTQVKAPAYYLKILLLPSHLSVDHAFAVGQRLTPTVMVALCLLVTIVLLVLWGRRTFPELAMAVLISMLVLAPTSLIPLNILVNERRIYLVLAAVCIAAPSVFRLRWRPAILVPIAVLAMLTVQRNAVWATPLNLWQDAANRGARSYTASVNLGKARQGVGDVAGAASAYHEALAIDDRRGDVYNNLAVLLHEAGRAADAIDYYHSALQRTPQMEEIHHNLAVAYQQVGDMEASLASFRRALELDRSNGGLWSNYGQLLLAVSDPVSAEQAYREAIRLLGERPEPINGLGNALSAQGRVAEAVEAYRRALPVAVDGGRKSVILANLGESLLRSQQPQAARLALEASLQLSANAAAHDYLGRLHLMQADTSGAVAHWEAAIRIESTRRVPLVGLGEIAGSQGDLDQAIALLRRAVAAGATARAEAALRKFESLRGQGDG